MKISKNGKYCKREKLDCNTIYLIRHGQTDWNVEKRTQGQTDTFLNDTGRAQAEIMIPKLADLKIEHIFSSDLFRARETAEILNRDLKLNIIFDARIREYNYGDLEGRQTIKNDWRKFDKDRRKYNAEPPEDVFVRVKSFLDEISDLDNVLIVTHNGTMSMMYYCVNNEKYDSEIYFKYYDITRNTNLEIVKLEKDKHEK